jgi:PAS domain S-box-containing protein
MSAQMDRTRLAYPEWKRAHVALQACAPYRRNLLTGRYEYVSPVVEECTGFSADEMYAMPSEAWLARIHPEDRHRVHEEIGRLAAGRGTLIEYRFQHKDGQYRWMAQRVDVQPGLDGSSLHCVGFLRRLERAECVGQAVAVAHWPSRVRTGRSGYRAPVPGWNDVPLPLAPGSVRSESQRCAVY